MTIEQQNQLTTLTSAVTFAQLERAEAEAREQRAIRELMDFLVNHATARPAPLSRAS